MFCQTHNFAARERINPAQCSQHPQRCVRRLLIPLGVCLESCQAAPVKARCSHAPGEEISKGHIQLTGSKFGHRLELLRMHMTNLEAAVVSKFLSHEPSQHRWHPASPNRSATCMKNSSSRSCPRAAKRGSSASSARDNPGSAEDNCATIRCRCREESLRHDSQSLRMREYRSNKLSCLLMFSG